MMARAFSVKTLRALLGTLDAVVPLQHVEDLAERNAIVVAVAQNRLHQRALVRRGALQRVNQRQRHLAFAQIAAHRLAETSSRAQ